MSSYLWSSSRWASVCVCVCVCVSKRTGIYAYTCVHVKVHVHLLYTPHPKLWTIDYHVRATWLFRLCSMTNANIILSHICVKKEHFLTSNANFLYSKKESISNPNHLYLVKKILMPNANHVIFDCCLPRWSFFYFSVFWSTGSWMQPCQTWTAPRCVVVLLLFISM